MFAIFFVLILGLVFGSFLGMLTYRIPRELSLKGRSFCDNCKKQISWYQNIPILSYFLLQGKSICCRKPISFRYPIIEITTAIFFVLSFLLLKSGTSYLSVLWNNSFSAFSPFVFLAIAFAFVSLAVIDLEYELLPDSLLKFLAIPIFLFLLVSPTPILFTHLLWGLSSFIFFLTIYLVTRGHGMGFGDVKMAFLLGSLLGFPGVVSWLFLSFFGGSLIGIILLILKRAKIGRPIPFGPFLLAGAFAAFFFGDSLFVWYINLLSNQ